MDEMERKLLAFLSMASEVTPGDESQGTFWCRGPEEEPPFTVMICVPTLLSIMAAHPDFVTGLVKLATSDKS